MDTAQGTPTVIVNRLSRLMGEQRLSIQELARRSGVSYGTVFDFYHDRLKRFDADVLSRLCAALNCTVGDILEYQPDPAAEPAQEGRD